MASMSKMTTVTASTKRGGGIDGDGMETAYAEHIASLKCLPLDPIDPHLAREDLAWYETLQTAVDGALDIIEGDILCVGTDEYPVRAVAEWTTYMVLYLEDRK